MSNTFCPIPWIFHAARSNGDMRVCCQANITANKGIIRKLDGTAYNVGIDTVDSSRNAKLMRAMRVNMLNGVWSDECGRCKQEENNGLISRRSYENQTWNYTIEDAKKDTALDGSIDILTVPITYYDLRFGNFCNFKCRMCGPADSDSWYDDHIKLTGKDTFEDTSGDVQIIEVDGKFEANGFDWYKNEKFWEHLESNVHSIRQVYLAGGEPMLIQRHYKFLELCVSKDVAKDIVIEYNTNMSTLPSRVIELWKNFKQVKIGASVDGFGPIQEYQRHGAKWDKTLRNLQIVDDLPVNISAWLTYTVTAYNIWHMPDFMKWKLELSSFKKINSSIHRPIVTHHVAHNPKNLNIRVLPDRFKLDIVEKFNSFVSWVRDSNYDSHIIEQAKTISNGICSYMNSESYYQSHWDDFLDYTSKLDAIRSESLVAVEPKFKEYL